MSLSELRFAWALLLTLGGAALVPATSGPLLPVVWVAAALPGTVVLSVGRLASRFQLALGELFSARPPRVHALLLVALLGFGGLIFSLSAAMFLATALGSAVLTALAVRGASGARAVLGHSTAFSCALVLVLLPLEFILRLPPISRQFGLPGERARQESSYDGLWHRNIFGFRSHYEQVARRPGVRRVLALGDSFTWGLLLSSADSAWPARLERRLDNPETVEVINMGRRGWATANEAEFLRRLGWQFDPDLVIVQFFLNDAYESGPDFQFSEGRRVFLLPEAFDQGYIRSSALAALVARGVNGLLFGFLFPESESEDLYAEDSDGWRQMRVALREMGDSARARDTPILFVLFPALLPGEWTPATYPARDVYSRVAREAARSGLLTLDLTEAFAAAGGDWKRWWATPYDSHPSADAHAVAADAIARFILQQRLLPVR